MAVARRRSPVESFFFFAYLSCLTVPFIMEKLISAQVLALSQEEVVFAQIIFYPLAVSFLVAFICVCRKGEQRNATHSD